LRAVAAVFSALIACLMLAQPVLGEETNNKITLGDAQGDLMKYNANYAFMLLGAAKPWPGSSPVQKATYLDMKEVSLEKQGDTFVATMTLRCDDLLANVEMPIGSQHGKQIAWFHSIINLDDGIEYMDFVWWDGSQMLTGDFCPDLVWSIEGATITMLIDEEMLGNPSSVAWGYGVLLCLAPLGVPTWGGCWFVDMPDTYVGGQSGYTIWPA